MYKLLLLLCVSSVINIYSYTFTDSKGNAIALSAFEGKKILLVNISTNSPKNYQLRGLQELYRLYKDSLVIIGVPSNSFGNEPHNAMEIDRICRQDYGVRFLISGPVSVIGAGSHPVYQWLADSTMNGAGNIRVREDFQKFLFDKTGNLMGIYSAQVDPLDSTIHKAIRGIF